MGFSDHSHLYLRLSTTLCLRVAWHREEWETDRSGGVNCEPHRTFLGADSQFSSSGSETQNDCKFVGLKQFMIPMPGIQKTGFCIHK